MMQRAGLPCFMPDRELHDRYLLGDGLVLEAWAYVAVYAMYGEPVFFVTI
jgi:hypothetical protein